MSLKMPFCRSSICSAVMWTFSLMALVTSLRACCSETPVASAMRGQVAPALRMVRALARRSTRSGLLAWRWLVIELSVADALTGLCCCWLVGVGMLAGLGHGG